MDLLYLSAIWGGVITLCILPLLCLLDIKTRNIPDKIILAYLAITLPAVAILYLNGLTIYYLLTSGIVILMWLIVRYFRLLGGGDVKFLMAYSFVVPWNPINLAQPDFQSASILWIGLACFLVMAITFFAKGDLFGRKFPMMIPIAIGIVTAMIAGVRI